MTAFHHFAISEAVLALAAIWCIWKFARAGLLFAAVGTFCFALAATLGTLRFGAGLGSLEYFHRMVSQIGGVAGIGLISGQFVLSNFGPYKRKAIGALLILAVIVNLLVAIKIPSAGTLLFIAGSIIGSLAALIALSGPFWRRIIGAVSVSGLLLDHVLVFQSPFLGANIRWHLYHILIAIWLIVIWAILKNLRSKEI
ncbi:MAG: hypothetical protein ACSHXY_05875 [Alphaproteobacteria bacterium]